MLSVCWDRHETAVCSRLLHYFREQALVDVALWCAGRRFQAHRAVLAACSHYLERLLLEHPLSVGEPVTVLLHGVEPDDVSRLLELMYRGQASVPAQELPRLLEAAGALGVRLLEASALRVDAAASAAPGDASARPEVAASGGDTLCTEVSYPAEKDVETTGFLTLSDAPLWTSASPVGQSRDPHSACQPAGDGQCSTATPPPPPPLSPPLPAPSLTQTANSPRLSPSLLATAPAQQPSTVDWLQDPVQTHLPDVRLGRLNEGLQPPPTALDPAVQTPSDLDMVCSTLASAPKPGAPTSMATAPGEGLYIPSQPISKAEDNNGWRVKPDDRCGSIHHPPHTTVSPLEKQAHYFTLQKQVNKNDEGNLQAERGLVRRPSPASDHYQQQQPPDLRPLLDTPRPQPPRCRPPTAVLANQLSQASPTQRPAVSTGNSRPSHVLAELQPSEPNVSALFAGSCPADEQQGDNYSELKNERGGQARRAAGDRGLLQSQQSLLPSRPRWQFLGENVPSATPKTTPKHGKENICEICCKNFSTRYSLKVHRRTHTGEKPHGCAQCGKRFSQRRNYRYHLSLHSGSREFEAACAECGKVFSDRGYLSSHMKIHRDRREYACAQCGRRFNQRVAYTMHLRTHSGERPHRCALCDKAFSRKGLLRQHQRTHTGEKPYACQVCGKQFSERGSLSLHVRLHACPRPYVCTHCGCSFFKKSHLRAHLLPLVSVRDVVTRVRAVLQVCGKQFSKRGSLSLHVRLHACPRPYACTHCGCSFFKKSHLRAHLAGACALADRPPPARVTSVIFSTSAPTTATPAVPPPSQAPIALASLQFTVT